MTYKKETSKGEDGKGLKNQAPINFEESYNIDMHSKVNVDKLAYILGKNSSTMYDRLQQGQFGAIENSSFSNITYLEALRNLFEYFNSRQEIRLEQLKMKERGKLTTKKPQLIDGVEYDDVMHPLARANLVQSIKLNRAKEAALWMSTAIDRGDYINLQELAALIEPFIVTIKMELLALSYTFPEIEDKINKLLQTLYELGTFVYEEAQVEANNFVDTVMAIDVDLNSPVENQNDIFI